jgi:signal transduction histidine kinase
MMNEATRGAHVLVVEDSPTEAARLGFILEDQGYRVSTARDGEQALARIRSEKPRLVVSDVLMPVMDGFELCRAIKADDELHDVPVILLTSLSNPKDVLWGLEARADYFLSKPCEEQDLIDKVGGLLTQAPRISSDAPAEPMRIVYEGRPHVIEADRREILSLLMATYDHAIRQNRRLADAQLDLRTVNARLEDAVEELKRSEESLEQRVRTRTAELEASNRQLASEVRERQRAEQELKQTLLELERSNAELQQFASVASHDLKEPLRTIVGYMEILQEDYQGQLDDDATHYVEIAITSAQRLRHLIDALLSYARVSTASQHLVPVDLAQIFDEVLSGLHEAVAERRAEVTRGPLPTVDADPIQMTQLLQNLIGNALKFGTDEPARVRVEAAHGEGAWEISVADNGIGMDPAQASRIFEIFQRLHSHQAYAGTGIGLAICERIVQRHGGRIWVESQPGEGATFRFTLPASAFSR